MESLISRYRNLTVLGIVLLAQVLGLAFQVKREGDNGSTRLIRLWTVTAISPFEKAVVHSQSFARNLWRNYFYLRDVREENERLSDENARLRMEQVRLAEDAGQAQRLQALLKFKEQYIAETLAAQVIGSSGSEQSRVVYLDKGASDGLKIGMAVVTPTGIVGKVMRVWPTTSQVLEINDQSSGVGAILEKSRLQGILKGTSSGEGMLHYIMSDEKVEVGERVLTSGGDTIFPKGLPIGTVVAVNNGPDMFLNIRVKPAAHLDRLEEVLVITKIEEKQKEVIPEGPRRAIDILAERLPIVPPKPPEPTKEGQAATTGSQAGNAGPNAGTQGSTTGKPSAGGNPPKTGELKPNAGNVTRSPGGVQVIQPSAKKPETGATPNTKPASKPATPNAKLPGNAPPKDPTSQ